MKRLLLASAMGLALSGCAPGDVQRNVPPQFGLQSQLAFHNRLQARIGDGGSAFQRSHVPASDLSGSRDEGALERGEASAPASSLAVGGAPAAPAGPEVSLVSADVASGEAETPAGPAGSGTGEIPSSGPGTPTVTDTNEDGSSGVSGSSDGGDDAPPATTPTGGNGKPKKDNPSCEKSGGHAATCG